MVADNSAGRLHDILKQAQQSSADGAAIVVWAQVLGLTQPSDSNPNPITDFEVIHRIQEIHKLVNEVEKELKSIPDLDHELFLRPFPRIRMALPKAHNLTSISFKSLINQITEGDMTVLEFCSRELSKHHAEKVIDDEIIKELLRDVDELFNEVSAQHLPGPLKTFVLQQLEIIRRAIQEYRIRGVERLEEALAHLYGNFWMKGDIVEQAPQTEQITKFRKVLNGFVAAVKFATHLKPLIGPASKAIGFLMSGDPDVPPPPMKD